jgi:hypothetical protein
MKHVVNDVNLLGDNIDTMKKNTDIINDASKEVGLKINEEKTKYTRMLLYRYQNVDRNRDIKIAKGTFEKCAIVQIFGHDSNK